MAKARLNGNGANGECECSPREALRALQSTYKDRGLVFKCFPKAKCAELRFQAGRSTLDPVTMPDGEVFLLEKFELKAWSATMEGLIKQLP